MDRADELERVIAHLDTLWEVGDPCIHPDTGNVVTNSEYDAMRRELEKLRPDSEIFSNPSASKFESGEKKITHRPPMTSINKASHEDLPTKEAMLFKWMKDTVAKSHNVPDDVFDLAEKNLPAVDPKTLKKTDGSTHHKERTYDGSVVTYPRGFFVQSYKLDGLAVSLYYEKGKLVGAGLRPRDGVEGEDVTEQIQYVNGVPKQLPIPISASIRGEIICKLPDFDLVQKELEAAGEEVRANPRNHAAGGIRQFKDPKKTKKMRLSFIAYGIENLETPDGKTPYKTEIERAIWCNTVLKIPFVRTEPFNFYSLADLEAHVPYLDYEVDGAVISVNDLEEQEQLGRHGDRPNGNPRGKVAWKFAEERQKPVIKEIVWQPGRTGVIKPVACFDAVPLAGTQVERATLHNLGFMIRGKIDVGTQIEVLKAGKIIPKVVGVVGGQCQGVPNHPKVCPSCGKPTTVKHTPAKGSQEEMWELICENKLCPAQNISGLCHFLTTLGILGLGDRRVQQLTSVGVVKEPADFFKITVKDCEKAGMSTRQALIAIGNIHMISKPDKIKDNDDLEKKITKAVSTKKKVQLWQLIAALGIPTAGKSAGKALVNHFHDFDRIRKASKEELQTVDEIGEKTSVILSLFFEENADVVDHLLQYIEPEQPKTGKLSGKKFVFSGGGFPNGKAFWEKQAEEKGATCSSSVSKTTDYLVAGEGSGTKSDAAKKYGIPIIDLDEFKKML